MSISQHYSRNVIVCMMVLSLNCTIVSSYAGSDVSILDESLNPIRSTVSESPALLDDKTHTPAITEEKKPRIIKILSLDGGGARGITEARFLEHLESAMGQSISEIFDMIGGTSAGSILAGFLTIPSESDPKKPKYSAHDLVELLFEESSNMFVPLRISMGGIFGPKYNVDCLRDVLGDHLGYDTTNNTTTDTVFVVYDLENQRIQTVNSYDPVIFTKRDILTAAASAPTYFSPCQVRSTNYPRKSYTFTDGGMGANNPTLCLLTEAMKRYPDADIYEIVSVGSGYAHKPVTYDTIRNASLFDWAPVFARSINNGQNTKDDAYLEAAFPQHYTRWTASIAPELTKLDNTSPENLNALIDATDAHIKKSAKFRKLVQKLNVIKSREGI